LALTFLFYFFLQLVSLKELEVKLNTQYTEEQNVKLLAGPQQKKI